MTRAACIAGLLVVAVGASVASSSDAGGRDGAHAADRKCGPGRSKVLLDNHIAAVRRASSRYSGGYIYACYFATGNPVPLDSPLDGSFAFRPPAMALAGHTLAYAVDTLNNESEASTRLWVIDVRKEQQDAHAAARTYRTHPKVGSVVVQPSGAVAWIDCDGPELGNGKFRPYCHRAGALDRVYRWPLGAKRPQLLDRSRKIDPSSLRRWGGTISWVRAGHVRRARLRD